MLFKYSRKYHDYRDILDMRQLTDTVLLVSYLCIFFPFLRIIGCPLRRPKVLGGNRR